MWSFSLNKAQAETLREKMSIFRSTTKTRKHLSWIMITTFGLPPNPYSLELIETQLTMDAMFVEV